MQGVPPSKKNSKIISCRGSRPCLFPSTKYKEWHSEQTLAFRGVTPNPIEPPFDIALTFYYDKLQRPWDLSNKAESVMDFLVDMKLIEDDNLKVVPTVMLNNGGQDKDNPRVEILISKHKESLWTKILKWMVA